MGWAAFDAKQNQGIGNWIRQITNAPWISFSRQWDEATFYIKFCKELSQTWIEWQLAQLDKDRRLLKDSHRERVAEALSSQRQGRAHIMNQRGSLRCPNGTKMVVFRGGLQRTFASNVRAVLETTMPELTTDKLMYEMCPFVGMAFYFVAPDEA